MCLIYKYRSYDAHLIDNIKNHTFWFPRVADLNDPFELDFTVDNLSEFIARWSVSDKNISETEKKALDTYIRETATEEFKTNLIESTIRRCKESLLVYSASISAEIPLLWSHYANGHEGVCMEIEYNGLPPPAYIFKDVDYISQPQIATPEKGVDTLILFQKHIDWAYECEIRLVIKDGHPFKTGRLIKGDHQTMSYKRAILGIKFPRKQIDEFTGVCEKAGIVVVQATQNHGYHKIKVD
jgi:Protein of unknown function (DUF2971)